MISSSVLRFWIYRIFFFGCPVYCSVNRVMPSKLDIIIKCRDSHNQSNQSPLTSTLALWHHPSNGSLLRDGCFMWRRTLSCKQLALGCWGDPREGAGKSPTWFWPELCFSCGEASFHLHSRLNKAGSWHTERTPEMNVQLIVTWKKKSSHFSEGIGSRIWRNLPGCHSDAVLLSEALWPFFWCLT